MGAEFSMEGDDVLAAVAVGRVQKSVTVARNELPLQLQDSGAEEG